MGGTLERVRISSLVEGLKVGSTASAKSRNFAHE